MLPLMFQSKSKCNWYVDSVSGNNGNTGRSPDQAFQTVATAMAACSTGQTIGLARGSTFTETVTIPANNIKLRAYGSGAAPIVDGGGARTYGIISSYIGTRLSSLAVTGCTIAGIIIGKGDFNLFNITAYQNVHNIYIPSTGSGGGVIQNCVSTSSQGGHNYLISCTTKLTIINCLADTTTGGGYGYLVNGSSGAIEFFNCIARNCSAGGSGFSISGSPNVTVNDCVSYSNGRSGFNFTDLASSDNVVTCINCYAYSNGEDGFSNANGGTGGHTSTVNCWYCKAYLNGTAGSGTAGDGFTAHIGCVMNVYYCIGNKNFKSGAAMTQTSSGVIYGCSFYDNYEASEATNSGIWMNATGTWIIKNNAIKHHTYEIEITAAAIAGGLNLTVDNNCYHNSRGANAFSWNGSALDWAGWLAACSQDTHSINVDPLFTDPVNSNFTLQLTSPCINAGQDLGASLSYALDPASVCPGGLIRHQQNAIWDIGAYGGY